MLPRPREAAPYAGTDANRGAEPAYNGEYPAEPWRDDPRFLAPTPMLRPTEIPGAFPGQHRPPEYGISDAEVEDHVLSDIGGATRWLIARYQHGDCAELTQFTVSPDAWRGSTATRRSEQNPL